MHTTFTTIQNIPRRVYISENKDTSLRPTLSIYNYGYRFVTTTPRQI